MLPYSIGSTVKVLRANGARAYTWQAPGPVTNTTAYQGQVAAFVKGGKCYVLHPSGGVGLGTYTFPAGAVQEFALAGVGLVVAAAAREGRDPQGRVGEDGRSCPRRRGCSTTPEGFVLYKLGQPDPRAAHRRRQGRAASGTGRSAVLEHNGLSYAAGKKVSSIAWVTFTAAVNSA